ncbi:PH domain-containing protein [Ligilactobacillus sp. LYQ60]|uniref:PH domain-containing protein n=1 Tax=Ligilactobacillus sp. LYQ60 TaxID=3378799 RepID=UPI003854DD06
MQLKSLNRLKGRDKQTDKIIDRLEEVCIDNHDVWHTKKEVSRLKDVLDNDELIIFATTGTDEDGHTVLAVTTDKRVFLYNANMFVGGNITDIPLNKISAVSINAGLVLAGIKITSDFGSVSLRNITKNSAKKLRDELNSQIKKFNQTKNQSSNRSPEKSQNLSDVEQIKQFKQLLDDGILTQEEFDAKKKQILGL